MVTRKIEPAKLFKEIIYNMIYKNMEYRIALTSIYNIKVGSIIATNSMLSLQLCRLQINIKGNKRITND